MEISCPLQHQNTPPSLASSSLSHKALEGLVLDLQVVSADLRGLHALVSNIESQLRELEVWVQVSEQAIFRTKV